MKQAERSGEEVRVHLLPCSVEGGGGAPVETYFDTTVRAKREAGECIGIVLSGHKSGNESTVWGGPDLTHPKQHYNHRYYTQVCIPVYNIYAIITVKCLAFLLILLG